MESWLGLRPFLGIRYVSISFVLEIGEFVRYLEKMGMVEIFYHLVDVLSDSACEIVVFM